MPDFRLGGGEAVALASYLQGLGTPFASLDDAPVTRMQADRVRRTLDTRFACLGCHEVQGEGGRIGPPLDGLGERLLPSFVLEMVLDPVRAAPGSPMPHQPMPARDAARLARWLLDLGTPRPLVDRLSLADAGHPARSEPIDGTRGATLYERHCSACHGREGRGDGWNASRLPVPPAVHADSAAMSARPDDTLFDGIHAGAWVLDGSPRMPAFGDMLSVEDIRALVAHIRTLCGCAGPAWSRDGSRGGP
jgi:mono/diheme cytochrome c family protein